MKKGILLVCILCMLPAELLFGVDVHTDYTEDNFYRTRGVFVTGKPFSIVGEVMTDFSAYNTWAFRGLDGKEPGTENFIGILKNTIYYAEKDIIELIYDVRLPWPMGSMDNVAAFSIENMENTGNRLSFDLVMRDKSLALKNASLEVDVFTSEGGCRIESTAMIRFSFLLNLFFSLPGYRKSIEWRVVRIISNMEAYINSFSVCDGTEAEAEG